MVNPTGYTALDLIGFTDKGTYNPSTNYVRNDIVTYSGSKWRCKVDDTTGVTPTEGATWTVFIDLPSDMAEQMIAPIEEATSQHIYAIGDHLIYNDVLYDVIAAIAVNDALVVGTNIEAANHITTELNKTYKITDSAETSVSAGTDFFPFYKTGINGGKRKITWSNLAQTFSNWLGFRSTSISHLPADGDMIQYDSSQITWKNSHDVWDTMAQNGAHNFFDINATVSKYTTTLYERTSTGFRVYNTTSGDYLWMRVPVLLPKNSSVTISTDVTRVSGSGIVALRYSDDGNTWTVIDQTILADSATKAEFTCNTGSHAYYSLWLYCTTATATTGDITYNNIVIRLATDPNTDYTPYAPTNRDCMSCAANTKLGAHNFLKNTATTQTINDITFTVNDDGSVTANGTASAGTQLTLMSQTYKAFPEKNFILSNGGYTNNDAFVFIERKKGAGGTPVVDVHTKTGEMGFTVDYSVYDYYTVGIWVANGTSLSNVTFKPMVRLAEDTDTTYAPYSMTNRELTEEILGGKIYNFGTSDAGTNVTFLKAQAIKMGDIVFLTGSWVGNNTNVQPIFTVPADLRPKKSWTVVGAGSGERNDNSMSTSGQYILNSSGELTQSLSTTPFKEGSFTFIYSISKS